MASKRRVDLRGILANPDLRRELMVPTLQATQAREGVETTREQAERAYYVVTEGEQATFFALANHNGGKDTEGQRDKVFAAALRKTNNSIRFDIARRDFTVIDGSPLAYDRIGTVAALFRENPLVNQYADAHQGVITGTDEPFIRCFWEVEPHRESRPWHPLHKGGDFSRFYYDSELVLDWSEKAKSAFHRLRDTSIYFKKGLTWPRRTQKGFNLRQMPSGCVFSDKGPSIFFRDTSLELVFLGIANSPLAEFVMQALMSFGSWEISVLRRFPLATGTQAQRQEIGRLAIEIHDTKASWDKGNEVCTRFCSPWLLCEDPVDVVAGVSTRLARLTEYEATEEARIQQLYAELNDEVYRLYGIPDATRAIIEETLGDRPPEVLWPQMEGKSAEQKRMEHIFRLLSYVVKRVVEADEDGVVPFTSVADEPSLLDRVHNELAALFPDHDVNQIEVEITNELKKSVKGYRKTNSIQEWLENVFFEYHVSLYKKRPILWHIASNQGTAPFAFGALVHYHKFDKNRVAKLRAQYLRDAIEHFRREAGLADKAGRSEERLDWQAKVEETQELDRKLQAVQEGQHEGPEGGERDFRILTPWKSPNERPQGWDPDLDDGVKVNIEPLQKAGILRVGKVV